MLPFWWVDLHGLSLASVIPARVVTNSCQNPPSVSASLCPSPLILGRATPPTLADL